jgi:hypothetical protein
LRHPTVHKLVAARGTAGAEERTAFYAGGFDVFGDRIGRGEVNAFCLGPVAFNVEPQCRLITILVEVRDVQRAAGLDARPGIEIKTSESPDRVARSAIRPQPSQSAGVHGFRRERGVSSTGSEATRAMNCAWAGFGTVIGSLNSAAAPLRNL